jgi:hypothetical protein
MKGHIMNDDERAKLEVMLKERDQLRSELQQLKNCQLRYFTLSVTGSGIILSIVSSIIRMNLQTELMFAILSPLAIVIPCWWIFFDKATTITRLTGYYQILEKMITANPKKNKYPYWGYENALAFYRTQDNKATWDEFYERFKKENPLVKLENLSIPNQIWYILNTDIMSLLRFFNSFLSNDNKKEDRPKYTRNQYWLINFWTFTLLSLTCISISTVVAIAHKIVFGVLIIIPFIFFICTFIQTLRLLYSLRFGDFSYLIITEFWHYILIEKEA